MGKGIQIRKPDHIDSKAKGHAVLAPLDAGSFPTLQPVWYVFLILTFPAAIVALYFFFQTRTV